MIWHNSFFVIIIICIFCWAVCASHTHVYKLCFSPPWHNSCSTVLTFPYKHTPVFTLFLSSHTHTHTHSEGTLTHGIHTHTPVFTFFLSSWSLLDSHYSSLTAHQEQGLTSWSPSNRCQAAYIAEAWGEQNGNPTSVRLLIWRTSSGLSIHMHTNTCANRTNNAVVGWNVWDRYSAVVIYSNHLNPKCNSCILKWAENDHVRPSKTQSPDVSRTKLKHHATTKLGFLFSPSHKRGKKGLLRHSVLELLHVHLVVLRLNTWFSVVLKCEFAQSTYGKKVPFSRLPLYLCIWINVLCACFQRSCKHQWSASVFLKDITCFYVFMWWLAG